MCWWLAALRVVEHGQMPLLVVVVQEEFFQQLVPILPLALTP
jgi:hypothetical protein